MQETALYWEGSAFQEQQREAHFSANAARLFRGFPFFQKQTKFLESPLFKKLSKSYHLLLCCVLSFKLNFQPPSCLYVGVESLVFLKLF